MSPFLKDVGNRGKPVEGMRSNTSTRIGLNSPKHFRRSLVFNTSARDMAGASIEAPRDEMARL